MRSNEVSFLSCLSWLGDSALQIDVRQLESLLDKGKLAPGVLAAEIVQLALDGITDIVPSYDMVTIHFSSAQAQKIGKAVEAWLPQAAFALPESRGQFDIPVCYEEPFAPDMKEVAHLHGMSCEEVIALHTAPLYEVVMLGFSPGFPYLDGLDARLVTPRLSTPRLNVPAGAVGIGGNQTGIYPTASPGGWRLIGQTPFSLFNPAAHPACLLSPGMRIRFVPITLAQYQEIMRSMAGGQITPAKQALAVLP